MFIPWVVITGGCRGSLCGLAVLSVFSPTHPRYTARDEGTRPQLKGQADQDPGGDGGPRDLCPRQKVGGGHAAGKL